MAWVDRRPLVTVAAVASAVAVGHVAWILTHRRLGTFDPDEAGYLANALSYHRKLTGFDFIGFARSVGGTGNGPVVPLMSLPFLLVGPADPRTAMLVQPLLLVCAAVLVAALTRHVTGPRASVVAGLTVVAMPTFVLGAQSYWYGLGASVVMGATALALLESNRLSNRWSWAFGAGCGLMVMTRTMTMAFVPGLFLAALVLVWPDRGRLRRLAATVGLASVIAGPWFLVNRSSILDYLLGYGYGPRAGLFGSGNVLDRAEFRLERIAEGSGIGTAGALLLTSAVVGSIVRSSRRTSTTDVELWRNLAVLAVPVICGFLALVSTSNSGVWFELPLVVLALPLIAALLVRSYGPFRGAVVAFVAVMLVVVSLTSWWLIPPRDGQLGFRFPGAHYEEGFALYDERFAVGNRGPVADRAANEWARLSADVASSLRPIDRAAGGAVVTMSGSMQLFNTNSVRLNAELDGWNLRIATPDTALPRSQLRELLAPRDASGRGPSRERVLVLALHRQHLFTPDEHVRVFAELARDLGWKPVRTLEMPDGGEVQILRLTG